MKNNSSWEGWSVADFILNSLRRSQKSSHWFSILQLKKLIYKITVCVPYTVIYMIKLFFKLATWVLGALTTGLQVKVLYDDLLNYRAGAWSRSIWRPPERWGFGCQDFLWRPPERTKQRWEVLSDYHLNEELVVSVLEIIWRPPGREVDGQTGGLVGQDPIWQPPDLVKAGGQESRPYLTTSSIRRLGGEDPIWQSPELGKAGGQESWPYLTSSWTRRLVGQNLRWQPPELGKSWWSRGKTLPDVLLDEETCWSES